jgi:ABC-type transport system involved in cytochrome bd biosynthesis fused ATPase/permease subunit
MQAIVTDEDDMESIANRFLSAAMKACSFSTITSGFIVFYEYTIVTCLLFFFPLLHSWIVNPRSVWCLRMTLEVSLLLTTVP